MSLILVDPKGDFYVTVLIQEILWNGSDAKEITKDRATFKVSRKTLIQTCEAFRTAVDSKASKGTYKDRIAFTSQEGIDIKEESIESVETWLRAVHGETPGTNLSLTNVWYVIALFDRYGASLEILNYWFATWYDHQTINDWCREFTEKPPKDQQRDKNRSPRALLYPSWRFHLSKAFMAITRFLADNVSGHIVEDSPIRRDGPIVHQDSYVEHHLPGRIIRECPLRILQAHNKGSKS